MSKQEPVDKHKRSSMMTRDEWMAWLEESWDEAQVRASTPEQKPVARITGFHNGHCVIQPTDPAVVLPVGMALYRAPTEWVGLTDDVSK
jgi:kynureninase